MNKLDINTVVVGYLRTNCYIVSNKETKECVIIDPGENPNIIADFIDGHGLNPIAILITHHHPDHIGALSKTGDRYGLKEMTFEGETELLGVTWRKLVTPGHTQDSVEYYLESEGELFSGDTLFFETFGRTDLEGGSIEEIIKSMKEVLLALPDDIRVWPGHGPDTTIGHERAYNPLAIFVQRGQDKSF